MLLRLQKYLADCGVASRRKAEELIEKGYVKVNDVVVTQQGVKVDDKKDVVKVRDRIVKKKVNNVYIMLHKPRGYVTTVEDQFDRPTVMDLLKDVKERVFPIGRLDYDTSGLLILTNDGELAYKLTHPKHNIDKVYIAKLTGQPSEQELKNFREGLMIDGRKTAKASIEIQGKDDKHCYAKISIKEGRNRQVRKMCEEIGYSVASLKRIATGELELGKLARGSHRYLNRKEVEYLKSLAKK